MEIRIEMDDLGVPPFKESESLFFFSKASEFNQSNIIVSW